MSIKRGYTSGQSMAHEDDNVNEQVRDLPMIELHKIDKSPNRTELTITGKLRNRFSAMDVVEEAPDRGAERCETAQALLVGAFRPLEPARGRVERALGLGDAGGVVHGHLARDHRLLVDAQRMLLDAFGRFKAHVFHLHLCAMA